MAELEKAGLSGQRRTERAKAERQSIRPLQSGIILLGNFFFYHP